MFGFEMTAGVVVVLALIVIFSGVKMVPQGYNWTIERFGRFYQNVNAWTEFNYPFCGSYRH